MLGNDVIDRSLAARQSNWRRKGYLDKIFSPAEQLEVNRTDDQDLVVWLIWSMKEAAYKIVNRTMGKRFFDPLALVCDFDMGQGIASGTVSFQQKVFATSTEIGPDFIHTIALGHGLAFSDVEVVHGANQAGYLQRFNLENPAIRLEKNRELLPEIYHHGRKEATMASISHHGSRLCVAFLRN